MLKAIANQQGQEILCVHWRVFPPVTAVIESRDPTHSIARDNTISLRDKQVHQTWKFVCGLLEMNPQKCMVCPCVRTLTRHPHYGMSLTTLDGKIRTPIDVTRKLP